MINVSENQLQSDINDLRERFINTQELYREVAAVLFFRYGITPTANKLYQLVRKGSMSAPAEALNRFWAELREKSRVRIEAPDLPDTLSSQAGELVAALWSQSQAQALESLATLRGEIETTLATLKAERNAATATAEAAIEEAATLKKHVVALDEQIALAKQELAAESSAKAILAAQLSAATKDIDTLQAALVEARQDFGRELEKTRALVGQAECRVNEDTRRHLLEIDRERGLVAKAQQETALTKSAALKQQTQDKETISLLHAQVNELRETSGNQQGQLGQLSGQLEAANRELDYLRNTLAKATEIPKFLVRREPGAKKRPTKSKAEKIKP